MLACYLSRQETANPIPIHLLLESELSAWLSQQTAFVQSWVKAQQSINNNQSLFLLPNADGHLEQVIKTHPAKTPALEWIADLPWQLPEGVFYLAEPIENELVYLGWALGAYRYTRYKKGQRQASQLVLPADMNLVEDTASAVYLTRELINTPAQDMMPKNLSEQLQNLAKEYQAEFSELVDQALLENNFPAVHAVGRASKHAPRLLELKWGKANHPLITLVGKGVCYDTGGLNIKPGNSMRLMKKDMGGAATIMGLAKLIMQQQLPVQLHLIIPSVDNAIADDAFRPGDIITMRNGLTVEVDNTDAEGRLILADAINYAVERKPELLIDFATLTGAARVAVGTDIAAYFTEQSDLGRAILQHSEQVEDPCWQLPLYQPYRTGLETAHADLQNCAAGSFPGATVAALFLQRFTNDHAKWLHLDMMAWNTQSRPAHPVGGEAMGLRAVFSYLQSTYAGQR